jgi:O-antigen/teichoic acid export membrane protein
MSDTTATVTPQPAEDAMPAAFGSLASGVAVTFSTRLVILCCTIGSSVIVAHWLGPEGTGALAVLNVTAALALQLGSAGIPSATTYFVAKDRALAAPIWADGLVFSIGAGALIALGVVAIANARPTLFNGVPVTLITVVAVSIPFQLVTLLGLNLLLAIDRIRLMNVLDALSSFLIVLNAIAVLVLWQSNLTTLVWFNQAAAIFVSLLVIGFLARFTRRGQAKGFDASLLKRMLAYGIKFYICIFAGFIIFRLDLLIVNRFRGAQDAGVYAIASQFSLLLIMLPGVIASLLFPRVAARREEPAAYAIEVTRHTSFIMLVVCAGAALASFVLPLVYGARFADATIQFLILLPGVFFISLESVLVQYFTGTGLPAIIPWFWIITVIFNVGLNLAFVPAFGARAAAVNSTASYALIFFLVAAYFGRKTGRNPLLVFAPRTGELRTLVTKLQRRAFAK